MKTFSLIWCVFVVALAISVSMISFLDYKRTKDEETISPEDLKALRKSNLKMTLILAAFIILGEIERLID